MKNISTKSSLVVVNIFEEEGDQYRILLSFLSLSERVVFLENSRGILEVKQTIFSSFTERRDLFDRKRGRRYINIPENAINIKLSTNQFYKFQYHVEIITAKNREVLNGYKEKLKGIFLKCNFIPGVLGSNWGYPRDLYFMIRDKVFDEE